MEIRIVISDSSAGVEMQGAGGALAGSPGGGIAFGPPMPTGAAPPGGGATYAGDAGTGPGGQASTAGGSVVQPPDYLARAAAALGARNGGPAPMLSGLVGGMSGEPLQFTAAAIGSPAMAAMGAPDQSAGAAPGAQGSVPTQEVEDQGAAEDEE